MSHKKYYGGEKPNEYYSIKFCDDTENGAEAGTLFAIQYQDGKFYMVKVCWGTKADYACSRDGEIEENWYFDEENTRKIMLRTGTHNAKDMMQAMYERFGKYKDFAPCYIETWCQKKEIKYNYYVHY